MSRVQRYKIKQRRGKGYHTGLFYIVAYRRGSQTQTEKIYYYRYWDQASGKQVEACAGRESEGITPAKAAALRAQRIVETSPQQDPDHWTLDRLFELYIKKRGGRSPGAQETDRNRWENHVSPYIGGKTPGALRPLDLNYVDRLVNQRKGSQNGRPLSKQTRRHILGLIRSVAEFGRKKQLCPGLSFAVDMPPNFDNQKNDYLSEDQLGRLLAVLDREARKEDGNVQAANLMRLALFTGLRRGELFGLRWEDIDESMGFIHLPKTKAGKRQKVPLTPAAKEILDSHPKTGSEYVFPGRDGERRKWMRHPLKRLQKAAGIPTDEVRPLHSLRHSFATHLLSSGTVTLVELQKLLRHGSSSMTERYGSIVDERLKAAAAGIDEVLKDAKRKARKRTLKVVK